MLKEKLIAQFRVEPGAKVDLKDYPTDWTETEEAETLGKETIKERALEILEQNRKQLAEAQELLYASDIYIGIFNRSYEEVLVVKTRPTVPAD